MIMEVSRIVVVLFATGVFVGSALAAPPMPGGREQANVTNQWVVAAATAAVQAQQQVMQKDPSSVGVTLTLVTILSAEQQVLAGMNYYLTLEIKSNDTTRTAEAVVWRRLSGEHKLTSWKWK